MEMFTELEKEILNQLGQEHPQILPFLPGLSALDRKYTGAGSFTSLGSVLENPSLKPGYFTLQSLISIPGVTSGLGAALACESGKPVELEIFTFGGERWHGSYEGFTIAAA